MVCLILKGPLEDFKTAKGRDRLLGHAGGVCGGPEHHPPELLLIPPPLLYPIPFSRLFLLCCPLTCLRLSSFPYNPLSIRILRSRIFFLRQTNFCAFRLFFSSNFLLVLALCFFCIIHYPFIFYLLCMHCLILLGCSLAQEAGWGFQAGQVRQSPRWT